MVIPRIRHEKGLLYPRTLVARAFMPSAWRHISAANEAAMTPYARRTAPDATL